jgi:hypothetical protein
MEEGLKRSVGPMSLRLTIIWLWKLIDPLFYLCSRLHYITVENRKKSIFRVRVTKYKGQNLILSDGTMINKNDLLLKIHLHNVRLLNEYIKIKNDLNRARLMYKLVLSSMPSLANYLKVHPDEYRIKGIIGITTINKGVKPLGFECFVPANHMYKRVKKLGQLPIFLLSSSSLKDFKRNKLNYLCMSKERLYERYYQKYASK